MNDRDIRESGHLMLITPERVFYAGLLGRPRERCSGAIHIYVAIEGGLRLAENIGLAKDFGPNVAAYWQRLQARDGYQRAVAAEISAGELQKVARRS